MAKEGNVAYSETKCVPYNHIVILNAVIPCYGVRNTIYFLLTLIGEFSSCPQLSVFVFGDPHVMLCKLCSFGHNRIRVSQHQLRRRRNEFVCDWLARNWVQF